MKFKFAKHRVKIDDGIKLESIKRLSERNQKTLFIRFPESSKITCHNDVKSIIPNAVSYRVPSYCKRNKYFKYVLAEFKSKEDAEEEQQTLRQLTLSDGSLMVDKLTETPKCSIVINPYRLQVTGIPKEASDDQLQSLFPNANVFRNKESRYRNNADFRTMAFLSFPSVKEAQEAFWAGNDVRLCNKQLLVLYAGISSERSKEKQMRKKSQKVKVTTE